MNSPRPRHKHKRQGLTLIELVMVIAVVSLLATLTARLLHAMIRQQTATTMQLALGNTITRVEKQLRTDLHRANEVEVSLASRLVIKRDDGHQVEWNRNEDWLVRTEDAVDRRRVEHYDLLPELEHTFDETSIEGQPFVTFELTRRQPNESGEVRIRDARFTTSRGGAKILAAVGRDLRYGGPSPP